MRKKRAKQQMAVCVRWSQYQGRAALQTPVTDLMDEVSHTHLQYEKRPSPSNTHGPSTMSRFHTTMFFCFFLVISFFFLVFERCALLQHIDICFQCALLSFH